MQKITYTAMIVTDVTETGQVFLDVIDEGPGIQPHELPRIFDKGFTGENGRIQNAATGLGLYLAKTLADKLGITLKVQPGQTKGTVMRMIFVNPNVFEAVRKGAGAMKQSGLILAVFWCGIVNLTILSHCLAGLSCKTYDKRKIQPYYIAIIKPHLSFGGMLWIS